MEDIAIYIAMHKPYETPQDAAYVPIHVGAAGKAPLCACRDDAGENISGRNSSFCELTALYWIWKHAQAETVGLVHYRRYFAGRGRSPWDRVLGGQALLSALEGAQVLLPRKRHYIIETNRSQYAHAHHEKDLILTRDVLAQQCPEYLAAFDRVMKRRSGHRFNMMVLRKALLDSYCAWLFPILFALEERIDLTGYDAYNRRVFGFLAERLLDVWLEQNRISFRELPVVSIEGENWPKKGFHFLLRKLRAQSGRK